jgi:hypothetical protein
LSAIISEETYERLEKLAKLKLWSVSQTARILIEQGLDREGIGAVNANGSNDQPAQAQSEPTSTKALEAAPPPEKSCRPLSLAELFAQKTLSSLVQENYYKLQESGKVGHQRLKAIASGDKPTDKERQIISQVLGIGERELPED